MALLLQCRSFDIICPFDYLAGDLRAGNPAAVFTAAFDAFCGGPLGYEFVVRENCSYAAACMYYSHAMDSSKPMPDTDNIRIQK